jgi:ferredoxin
MAHIITSLCLTDNACMAVCPVECIKPGDPADQLAAYKDEVPLDIFAQYISTGRQ